MYKLFLTIFISSFLYGSNFIKSKNVVIDIEKNIMWQDNIEVKQNLTTFSEAKNYCKGLMINNFTDWRLPTVKELQSIVDIKRSNPAINDQFKFCEPTSYWSSSHDLKNKNHAWYVGFKAGATYKDSKDYDCYVRCIRKRFEK